MSVDLSKVGSVINSTLTSEIAKITSSDNVDTIKNSILDTFNKNTDLKNKIDSINIQITDTAIGTKQTATITITFKKDVKVSGTLEGYQLDSTNNTLVNEKGIDTGIEGTLQIVDLKTEGEKILNVINTELAKVNSETTTEWSTSIKNGIQALGDSLANSVMSVKIKITNQQSPKKQTAIAYVKFNNNITINNSFEGLNFDSENNTISNTLQIDTQIEGNLQIVDLKTEGEKILNVINTELAKVNSETTTEWSTSIKNGIQALGDSLANSVMSVEIKITNQQSPKKQTAIAYVKFNNNITINNSFEGLNFDSENNTISNTLQIDTQIEGTANSM